MADAVLPKLSQNSTTSQLPSDPTDLLTSDQRKELTDDLFRLARLRRDAETSSASLKLA